MDNNDCYIITLRCEKEGTLDSLPKTYLGAQFDIQYIQYKPY
jgi:hypothetical protein